MSKDSVLGTLVIVVLKAQHLIDNHTFYKQDPYVKLSLSGATKQTPVDPKGGQHPVWDVELRFPISRDPSKINRTLTISVFSEEKKDDELLGEGTVDITDTLKTGEFDDWVPLTLKDTQRGDVYLEMTFFAAGPAPLTRRPSKFTSPSDRLARPQPPTVKQRVASQPSPSLLTPHGQAPSPHPQDGPRQGRPQAQQVPLPGPWPGKSAQQQQPPQQPVPSHAQRRSSRDEDAPLPPLPVNVVPKEESVPSTLRPGGPSRTAAQPTHDTRYDPPAQERHPAIPNGAAPGTAGYHHVTNTHANTSSSPTPTHSYPLHQNQNTPPFPGSPAPQARIPSSSPQPQGEPQPHARRVSLHSTQGSPGHVGYSVGGYGNTQPSPHTQPEFTHAQYHSPSQQPPQQQHHVQYSPWQQTQPPAGQPPLHVSSYPPNSHSPTQSYVATQSLGSTPPGHSHVVTPSPAPSAHSYVTTQSPPPAQSRIQTPSPVPVVLPTHSYTAASSNPISPPLPYATTTSPAPFVLPPPPQHYIPSSSPVPPTQLYAATPVPSTQPYTTHTSPAPPPQHYIPPTIPLAQPSAPTPPPQLHIPSTHPIFSLPTSPPPMPPYGPSFNSPPAPSFPAPSFPVPQATADYFGTVPATAFSPQDGPNLPDPYLLRRYQAPLPLPPGVSHPPSSSSAARQMQMPSPAPAVSNRRRDDDEDELAARELQRREEESARTRREQEERDAELARSLDMELNLNRGGERAQGGPHGPPHLPPRHAGVVSGNMPGGW